MTMTPTEARELRATLEEALNPLYAARTGTVPALDAVLRAIPVLHRIDRVLLGIQRQDAARRDEALAAAYVEDRARAVADLVAGGE